MGAKYDELYEGNGHAQGERMAVRMFDLFVKTTEGKLLLQKVVEERQDYIISDRECAAFMLALDEVGYF